MNRLQVVTNEGSWVVWSGLEGVAQQYFSPSAQHHARQAKTPWGAMF